MTLGGRIAQARESADLTDKQLASRLGVMLKTVRQWEADRTEPRGNKLATLSGVLGVSLIWLTSGRSEFTENEENLDETKALQVKMDRLLNLHEQSSALIVEIQEDIQKLQGKIDRDDIAI